MPAAEVNRAQRTRGRTIPGDEAKRARRAPARAMPAAEEDRARRARAGAMPAAEANRAQRTRPRPIRAEGRRAAAREMTWRRLRETERRVGCLPPGHSTKRQHRTGHLIRCWMLGRQMEGCS